jgi:hypothetical protein
MSQFSWFTPLLALLMSIMLCHEVITGIARVPMLTVRRADNGKTYWSVIASELLFIVALLTFWFLARS